MKELFDENIKLKFSNLLKPYIFTTNASDYAIAGILSQRNDNNEEEIFTFVNRVLKNCELNYFTTEKKMLAVVWSFNKLKTYLIGSPLIYIRTNHEALNFLNTCKFENSRLQRWQLALQDYNLNNVYLPGRENKTSC